MGRALARNGGDATDAALTAAEQAGGAPAEGVSRPGLALESPPLAEGRRQKAHSAPEGGLPQGGSIGIPAVVVPASPPPHTFKPATTEGSAEVMKVPTDRNADGGKSGQDPMDAGASPMQTSTNGRRSRGASIDEVDASQGTVNPVSDEKGDEEEDEEELQPVSIVLAGFSSGSAHHGMGRGRLMSISDPGAVPGLHGRGMGVGRGRALAPPPGLQSLNLEKNRPVLGGLARAWMPGPPIPEAAAEDDTAATPGDSPMPAWPPWPGDFELPQSAFLSLGEAAMSSVPQSSYVGSPRHDWGQTPSTFSPAESPALRPGVPFSGAALGLGGSPDISAMQPAVIPMYVTVPVATTHACPHCGRHFALPPEGLQPLMGTEIAAH